MAETTTIARPYAQAVFALAREKGELGEWSEMLRLGAMVASDADMLTLIDSPHLDKSQLAQLFIEICAGQLNEEGKNLIRVLAENNRLPLLPDIAALYETERAAVEGTIVAEVISATALSEARQTGIAAALTKRLGREVTLECRIDESLLGGAVIRAGDVVIDGSVTGKLNKLANALTH
jgi:F-type H+-transporting ATPase subunit delta